MIVLNFAHPFTAAQLNQIETIAGEPIDQVLDFKVQFDLSISFADQVETLANRINLDPDTMQKELILVNLPSFNVIAAALVSWLEGLMGYLPSVIRISPNLDKTPTVFDVVEIINLHALRNRARMIR